MTKPKGLKVSTTSKVSEIYSEKMAEAIRSKFTFGKVAIKVVSSGYKWVVLEIKLVDSDTKESIIEIGTIRLRAGDTAVLADLEKAFHLELHM